MKGRVLLFSVILLTGLGAAHSGNDSDVASDPGLVKPGSPLYGAEVAVEDALVGTPLVNPGRTAFERASEMKHARERGLNKSFDRAEKSLNRVSEVASSRDASGLAQAEMVLHQVKEMTPESADSGLDKALENLGKAKEREFPDAKGRNDQGEDADKGKKSDSAGGYSV